MIGSRGVLWGSGGILGGLGESRGVCLTPIGCFLPLWKSCIASIGPPCGVWNQIWCHTRLSEG